MIKNQIIFGLKPEATKMGSLNKEFDKHTEIFQTKVYITAKNNEILDRS